MQALADKISESPAKVFGTGFAASAFAALLAAILAPWLGAFLTPNGAQALLFALILVAIISAIAVSLTALSDRFTLA